MRSYLHLLTRTCLSVFIIGNGCTGWAQQASASASSVGAALPFKRDTVVEGIPASAWGVVALLVIVLIASAALALYRSRTPQAGHEKIDWTGWLQNRPPAAGLQVMTSIRLDAHTRIHVVEWGDRQFLLARSEQGIVLLSEKDAAVPASSSNAISGTETEKAG